MIITFFIGLWIGAAIGYVTCGLLTRCKDVDSDK